MSEWDWVINYYRGTPEQRSLLQLAEEALDYLDTNPDHMLALLNRGQVLAEQLNEPWWALFYEHWKLQALIFRHGDLKTAQDLAVKATIEARKPIYAQLPQRICLHEDLINVYVGIDPNGYAAAIENALAYMAQEITPDLSCTYCHQGLRTGFLIKQKKWDEARTEGLRYLAMSDGNDHYLASALSQLCRIALAQQGWTNLADWAKEGEKVIQRSDTKKIHLLAEFLAWQALASRQAGQVEAAERLYQAATLQASRLTFPPSRNYYHALSAYHEMGQDLSLALAVRQQELAGLMGKGKTFEEYECRRESCRLLAKMGQSLEPTLAEAQQVARQLKNPEQYLAELDRIANEK